MATWNTPGELLASCDLVLLARGAEAVLTRTRTLTLTVTRTRTRTLTLTLTLSLTLALTLTLTRTLTLTLTLTLTEAVVFGREPHELLAALARLHVAVALPIEYQG